MSDPIAVTNAIAEAQKWLGYARDLLGNNESNLGYMEEFRKKAGASYEDIGTSAEEVAALKIGGYKAEAKKWLGYARNLLGNNDSNLGHMEEFRKMAGASYEDIGTSEAEVAALKIGGYKAEAKKWLGFARNPGGNKDSNLGHMEEFRKMAGASYADIGTTAEEVAALRQKSLAS